MTRLPRAAQAWYKPALTSGGLLPSPATIDALIELIEDPLLSTHCIYGLGTAARRLRLGGATADSARAGRALLDRLESAKTDPARIHALRGIANSGSPEALEALGPYLAEQSVAVQAAAVEAFRLIDHAAVDPLLVERLERSAHGPVQLAALNAMKVRPPSDVLAAGVAQFARTSSDPFARMKALELIARWLPKRAELRKVVEELAENDARPRIRDAARAALGT